MWKDLAYSSHDPGHNRQQYPHGMMVNGPMIVNGLRAPVKLAAEKAKVTNK